MIGPGEAGLALSRFIPALTSLFTPYHDLSRLEGKKGRHDLYERSKSQKVHSHVMISAANTHLQLHVIHASLSGDLHEQLPESLPLDDEVHDWRRG